MIVNIVDGLSKSEERCGRSLDSDAQAVTAQMFTRSPPSPLSLALPASRLLPYGFTKYEEIKSKIVDSQAHAVPAQNFHAPPPPSQP